MKTKLEILMGLKKSAEDNLETVNKSENDLIDDVRKLKSQLQHIQEDNIFGHEVVDLLKNQIKFKESQLENFRSYKIDYVDQLKSQIKMINVSIETLK